MHAAGASLDYIARIGVANIAAHAAPLARRLRDSLPSRGYALLSPEESVDHITSFSFDDRATTAAKLERANVQVRLAEDFMRVSLSVFNNMDDIESLISALS